MEPNVIGPASYKQRIILTAQENIVLTGGGAGSGKSTTCLMRNLDAIDDPYFKGVITRKTRPELTQTGGLVQASYPLYTMFGGKYNKTEMMWTFPSGATIQFIAVPDLATISGRQGLQASRCMIDEVGDDWEEETVLFLNGRIRNQPQCKVKEQLFMTCNPNPNSFLMRWLEYCLDPETGIPKPGTEDIVRYLAIIDGNVCWGDSPEQVYEEHGKPRGLIWMDHLTPEELSQTDPSLLFSVKSFRFIPCTIYDNPYLLPPQNLQYLPSLLAQPKKNQMKFLWGSWKNIDLGQNYFNRSSVTLVDKIPEGLTLVRAWDLAATAEPTAGFSGNPDYSVGVLAGRSKTGHYYILDVNRFRKKSNEVIDEIIRTAHIDGVNDVDVVITKDPGAAGSMFYSYLSRTLVEHGVQPRGVISSGWTNKLKRFLPFCALCESGNVSVLVAPWNKEFFEELEAFTGGTRNQKDDQVDAVSDSINTLARQNTLPNFVLSNSDLTRTSVLTE